MGKLASRRPQPPVAVPGTAAFSKFIAVLQLIADAPQQLTMPDLCSLAGLPRATVYRIVNGLAAEGLVSEHPERNSFSLGPRLISWASKSWETFDLRTLAHEELDRLRTLSGETVHLAVPSGTTMVFMEKVESPQAVRMTSRIGTQVMLHVSSVGKAYLASLRDEECAALLDRLEFKRMTRHTLTERADVEAEILRTRERGYALDIEENELDICCIGAAVTNRTGRAIAAISISLPRYRFSTRQQREYAQLVVECAKQVTRKVTDTSGPGAD
jgi:IclR family KDG regulon transcriptional repressor